MFNKVLKLLIIISLFNFIKSNNNVHNNDNEIITRTIWVEPGQPVTIPCNIKQSLNNNNYYLLEWRKNSQTIFTANGNETGHYISSLQGKYYF